MTTVDIDAYLERLGLAQPLPVNLDTLTRLHVAHLAAFTFTNLAIQQRRAIAVDVDSVQKKFLEGDGGGYCFEQNTLFAAALRALGFETSILLGRAGPPDRRLLNHMLLRVDIDNQAYLADVGFGGEGPLEPLPLVDRLRVRQDGIDYALRRGPHHWTLSMHFTIDGNEVTEELYEFSEAPHTEGDVEMANHYIATHPGSIFRNTITFQQVIRGERLILRPRVLTRYRNGVRTDTPLEPGELRRHARELFNIDLGEAPLLFEEPR